LGKKKPYQEEGGKSNYLQSNGKIWRGNVGNIEKTLHQSTGRLEGEPGNKKKRQRQIENGEMTRCHEE